MSMFGAFKIMENSESAVSAVVATTSIRKRGSNYARNYESAIPEFCIKWLLNCAAERVPHYMFII